MRRKWSSRAAQGARFLGVVILVLGCDAESPGPLTLGDAAPPPVERDDASAAPPPPDGGGSGGRTARPPTTGGRPARPPAGDAAGPRDGAVQPEPPGSGGAEDASRPPIPPVEAGPSCAAKKTFYADADADGFGDAAAVFVGCEAPAQGLWVEVAGDCNDESPDARPTQSAFFGDPHVKAGGESSYDYDCSGGEEPDPSQPLAPTACGLLSLTLCGGEGHVATPRGGPGLDPHCGSRMKTTCRAALGILVCEAVTAPTEDPFRCR